MCSYSQQQTKKVKSLVIAIWNLNVIQMRKKCIIWSLRKNNHLISTKLALNNQDTEVMNLERRDFRFFCFFIKHKPFSVLYHSQCVYYFIIFLSIFFKSMYFYFSFCFVYVAQLVEFPYSLFKSMAVKLEHVSNNLEGFINIDGQATTLKSLFQRGGRMCVKICICNKFPGDSSIAGSVTTL